MLSRRKRGRVTYENIDFGESPVTIVRRAKVARLWISSVVPVGNRRIPHSFGLYFNEFIGKYVIADINVRGTRKRGKRTVSNPVALATAGWTLRSPKYLSPQRLAIMRLIEPEGVVFAPFASDVERAAAEAAHVDIEALGPAKLAEGACGNYLEAYYGRLD